jgi:hypothetical protein
MDGWLASWDLLEFLLPNGEAEDEGWVKGMGIPWYTENNTCELSIYGVRVIHQR